MPPAQGVTGWRKAALCGLAVLASAVAVTVAGAATSGIPPAVFWDGTVTLGEESTRLTLTIEPTLGTPRARLGLPEAGVAGWTAEEITDLGSRLRFTFVGDTGPTVLEVAFQGNRLDGTWTLAGPPTAPGTPAGAVPPAIVQLARRPAPVRFERDLVFRQGDAALSGTLLLPAAAANAAPPPPGIWPGVVLVPAVEDATREDMRFLAEYLADQGIASFSYDQRGAGRSTGDWRKTPPRELALDVAAAVALLRTQRGVDPLGVGVRGEGPTGGIAPLAATLSPDIAFVVAVSVPMTPEVAGKLKVPLLALYGEQDPAAAASIGVLRTLRDQAAQPFSVLVYPEANAALRAVPVGTARTWPVFADGYLVAQARWLRKRRLLVGQVQ